MSSTSVAGAGGHARALPGTVWLVTLVLAVAGAAAAIVGLGQPWFSIEIGDQPAVTSFLVERLESELTADGWASYDALDVVLVVAAAIGAVAALVPVPPARAARAAVLVTAGLAVLAIVAWRLADPPSSQVLVIDRGPWISLGGGIALLLAGVIAAATAGPARRR